MARPSYKLSYAGNKRIEQSSVDFCKDCADKLRNYNFNRSSKFRSVTCAGCSKTLREAAEGKSTPDYSSAIIILLENANVSGVITRNTRASDVKTKADGAVKISKAITEAHDVIQLHLYESADTLDPDASPTENLQNFPSDYQVINNIANLPNFEYEVTQKEMDDFVDIYVYIYHRNSPSP